MEKRPIKQITAILIREIDRGTRDLFKALCARQGTNMTAKLVEWINKEVEQEEKNRK